MALDAITREAARAAVLSPMPHVGGSSSVEREQAKGNAKVEAERVARGYGYSADEIDLGISFERGQFEPGSWVRADASVKVNAIHLPFIAFLEDKVESPKVKLESSHWERVDPFRGFSP
jgi:hypothetical protein